ncbi:helix-turn-helix transcriptional regulator [Actinoplanes sp. N902-109]|uniref:helix-turn-helix transcriptional regulator n=1 Tax=Actinoplanes sp. (strain N902-109) TaxID=649831 RepID=UPI0006877B2E|nr:helix-turn-helix transcriptional regulator [Actinoplanes sp. N902-109]
MLAQLGAEAGLENTLTSALAAVQGVVPLDAVAIALADQGGDDAIVLARSGYPDSAAAYFDSPAFRSGMRALAVSKQPLTRSRDLGRPLADVPAWAQYMQPAGFRDAVACVLLSPDGRFLGVVCAQVGDRKTLDDAACGRLSTLLPLVAAAVDPMNTVRALARLVADAVAGVALLSSGTPVALPGLPGHALLHRSSPVWTVVQRRLDPATVCLAFLAPTSHEPASSMLRVTVLQRPALPDARVCAVVLLSPPPPTRRLTRRELEVLDLLIDGGSNAHIASRMQLSVRTVIGHVGNIMAKLGAASRAAAAAEALRAGLFIPYEGFTVRSRR